MQCTFIVVSYILAAGSLYNLCSSNINAHIVSARLQLVFLCSTTHKPSTDSLYAIHLFFMPISIQTERQKEINISIKMIYHSRPQRKLNMLLGQHVSKTKQNILVVTFGKCSILSLSFEFSCFGIITFVVRIVRRIMRSFTSFFDNHICHMFTFAFYCPCGPNTKWVETCQNTDNNRIDLSAKVSCILWMQRLPYPGNSTCKLVETRWRLSAPCVRVLCELQALVLEVFPCLFDTVCTSTRNHCPATADFCRILLVPLQKA